MAWSDEEVSDYCHCGNLTMVASNDPYRNDFNYSLRVDYCRACATARCDTSDGMLAGCPNART